MIQIVVLQRGWVVVGDVTQEGEELIIRGGSVVRRWGTSKGLGELAESGPLTNTALDTLPGETRVHQLTTILRTNCDQKKWSKHVKEDL